MRTRLFIISSLAVAAVMGASSAAQAIPKGPGDLSPTPTTQPCCKDKIAPKPTTTTIPPKGPGDIAPAPPKGDDFPKGPDDIADAPKDDGPKGPGDIADAPKNDGGNEPGPGNTDTDEPSNNGGTEQGSDPTGEPVVDNGVDDTTGDAAATQASDSESAGVSPFILMLAAAVVAGLIALLVTRRRRDDETTDRV